MNASELKSEREIKEKILKGYRLMDDPFMSKVFEDKKCTEALLRALLKKPKLKVIESRTQVELKNMQGKSSTLDVLARDTNGRIINIEIQRELKKCSEKRIRYYNSLIDNDALKKGDEYSKLPEKYVIVIFEQNFYGKGYRIYHIIHYVKELKIPFNDGSHILLVDVSERKDKGKSKDKGNTKALYEEILADFLRTDPNEMKCKAFARRVRELKETEKGKAVMNGVIQKELKKRSAEDVAKGIAKGVIKGRAEQILIEMEKQKMSFQKAMDRYEIPTSEQPLYAKAMEELKKEKLKSKKSKQVVLK